MNRTAIRIGKIVVGAVWAYGLACFAVPTLPLASTVQTVAIVMGVAHLFELAIFRGRWRNASGSTAAHVVQILLFGFFHAEELALEQAERQPSSAGA